MKLGFVSVEIHAKTGYGRMVREICRLLMDRYEIISIGHGSDVIIWGSQHPYRFEDGREIKTLNMINPLQNRAAAAEMVRQYCAKYKLDYLVGHWDAFALPFLQEVGKPYAAYIPIDAPMTQKWANFVGKAHKVIAYSLYGYEQLAHFFDRSRLAYIPHGIDTGIYKPLENKQELRKKIPASSPMPEDAFLFVSTQANVGPRKHIPLLLRTFAKFAKSHPDAHLYLHTNAIAESPTGYDIPGIVDQLGAKANVHWPYYNPILEPASDEDLAGLYNAADVYLSNSCFSAGTLVSAKNIIRGFSRTYSGLMIEIETECGRNTWSTLDHPYLTGRGWQPASKLATNDFIFSNTVGEVSASRSDDQTVDPRRVEDIVRELSHQSERKTRRDDRTPIWFRGQQDISATTKQTHSEPASYEADAASYGDRSRLPRWTDRRRRDHFPEEVGKEEDVFSGDLHRQLVPGSNGLVAGQTQGLWHSPGEEESIKRWDEAIPLLHVPIRRPDVLRALQNSSAIPHHQKASDELTPKLDRDKASVIRTQRAYREGIGNGFRYPSLEYEAIEKIRIRPVEHIAVYNLETASHAYLANGILVHNCGEGFGLPILEAMSCGIPAIAPDNSSHTELLKGHGWLVKNLAEDEYVDYPLYVPTNQEYPVPNQLDMLNCMEEAYYDGKKRREFAIASRSFALEYDWAKMAPRWFELLDSVDEEMSLFADVRNALKV